MKYLQMGTDCYKATDNNAIEEAIKSFIIYQQGNLGTLKVYDEPTMVEASVMEMDLDVIFKSMDELGDYQCVYWDKDSKQFKATYSHEFFTYDGGDSHDWQNKYTCEEAKDIIASHNITRWLMSDLETNYKYCIEESYDEKLFHYMTKLEFFSLYEVHREHAIFLKEDDSGWDSWLAFDATMNRYFTNSNYSS